MHLYTLDRVLSGGEKDKFRRLVRKSGVPLPALVAHRKLNAPRVWDSKEHRSYEFRTPLSLQRRLGQKYRYDPVSRVFMPS